MTSRNAQSSPLRAYLSLVRPPNITTALADVLAGYGVAGLGNAGALPWLLVATACLYGGGVALNDFFDRRLDQIERPERPIPSGRVPAAIAGSIGGLLLVVGVVAASRASAAAATIALAIACLALIYDAWGKHGRVMGPVTIASCRGLNLLLGVAAVPAMIASAWPVAALPFAYIAAITALSRGEVHGGNRAVATFSLSAGRGGRGRAPRHEPPHRAQRRGGARLDPAPWRGGCCRRSGVPASVATRETRAWPSAPASFH